MTTQATKKISPIDKRFVIEYVKNGHNGTQAYLSLHPNVTYMSAATLASEVLSKIEVKEYLDKLIDKQECAAIASRTALTNDAHEIFQATKHEKPQVALNALNLKAKLHHLYDKEDDSGSGHAKLMQALQVNVNVNTDTTTSCGATIDEKVIDSE